MCASYGLHCQLDRQPYRLFGESVRALQQKYCITWLQDQETGGHRVLMKQYMTHIQLFVDGRALDLDARSDADPEQLLASFSGRPPMAQRQAVNDLEPPAFGMCAIYI